MQVHRYQEKTLQQRLEMLYQRNMFPLALDLAQKAKLDSKQQSAIYKRFGDHLYHKADYDNAMVQYIRAIDTTEPSQVIRKVGFSWASPSRDGSLTQCSSLIHNASTTSSYTLSSSTNTGRRRQTTQHYF